MPRSAATTEAPVIDTPRPELWPNSGYRRLARDQMGWLAITDAFLTTLWQRPEVAPVAESCDAERALHAHLLEAPAKTVTAAEIDAMADPDARENYRVLLDFRDRLIAAGSIEACYLALFRSGAGGVPTVFVDSMAQLATRALLEGNNDPMRARAGELMFREQRATIEQGAILLGDDETVERLGRSGGLGSLGRLVRESGTDTRSATLDVLLPETAESYWPRNESFDYVLDLSFGRHGLDALCRVLEGWVRHFLTAAVRIQPVAEINDARWVWHLGLDAEASVMLDELYRGETVPDERLTRLLSLFRLEFDDPAVMRSEVAGRPVYLGLAMTEAGRVRLKPQNLLVNLPLAQDI